MTKHLVILGTTRMANLETLLQCTTEEKTKLEAKLALNRFKKKKKKKGRGKKKGLEQMKTCYQTSCLPILSPHFSVCA